MGIAFHSTVARLLPTLLVLIAAVGCAGNRASFVAGATQASSADGAEAYDTRVPKAAAGGGNLVRAIAASAATAGLERDPRLDAVAQRVLDSRGVPPASFLDALMGGQGLVEPVPEVHQAAGTEPGVREALAGDGRAPPATLTHWGIAVREGPRGTAAVLVRSSRRVQLDPVPRSVAAGSEVALRGTLTGALRNPRWIITPPRGDVQRLASEDSGSRFDVRVPLDDTGPYRLELVADGSGGVTVVANFPVWSGQSPPPVPASVGADGAELDAAAVQARLRTLIAREREAAGRAALADSPALDAVALAHGRDMVEHDFVAHRSPRTGGPDDRVRAAGLSAWLVRENLGRGRSAADIHHGLMQSPGHRDNLLSTDAESLGLAVVEVPGTSPPSFIATELFVGLTGPVDVARARREVQALIHRTRAQAELAKARPDKGLARAAQAAADRYFQQAVSQDAVLADAVHGAPLPADCQGVGGSMAVVLRIAELSEPSLRLHPEAKRFGVGVAQGQRPGGPPHALAVVILSGL